MILMMCSGQDLPDTDPRKDVQLVDSVRYARARRHETGEMALDVEYSYPLRELTSESFILQGNAYLMDDTGKTIRSFSPNPVTDV